MVTVKYVYLYLCIYVINHPFYWAVVHCELYNLSHWCSLFFKWKPLCGKLFLLS